MIDIKINVGGPVSSTLLYATVYIVNQQTCAAAMKKYGMPLTRWQICNSAYVTAACQGDSGGPIVCRGRSRAGVITNVVAGAISNQQTNLNSLIVFQTFIRVLGIVSYGVKCNSGVPEVNTRVSSYSDLVNFYAVILKDAVVDTGDSGNSTFNCTEDDVDCFPKVNSVR